VPADLSRLAELQAGVVTREQALGLGFGPSGVRRMVRTQGWSRMAPGIYRLGPDAPPWPALAWAGVLIGGDGARLAGRAAAHLHRLVDEPPEELLVLVPAAAARPAVVGPWAFRRERPGVRSPRSTGAPARTLVEDTVLDLVAEADRTQVVVDLVTRAVQARLTDPARLLRAVRARRVLRHRRFLLDLLGEVAEGVRSPLERDFLHRVERPHGLPHAQRQVRQRGTEVDVGYEEYGTLVELDGRVGHSGPGRFRDMRRDNASTTDGYATLRYGYADVHDRPCEVAAQLAGVLRSRGWPGPALRCPRCRLVAPV
jgi:very-short-patch-repair endonuclease